MTGPAPEEDVWRGLLWDHEQRASTLPLADCHTDKSQHTRNRKLEAYVEPVRTRVPRCTPPA